MTVYSHNTVVDTLEARAWPGRNPFGNTDALTRVTQPDGSVEYLVRASGRDPWSFGNEVDARRNFEDLCSLREGA